MRSAPLRVAIVGAGKAGRQHATALDQRDDAALALVVDPDALAGQRLAADHGARWAPSLDALDARALDAAVVATPHRHLETAALRCAELGLATLVEKPMALDLAGADRVVDAFAAGATPLQVGFVHRYRMECRAAKALIDAGAVGRPTLVTEHKPYGVQTTPPWVWRRDEGGGALLYNGIHGLDRIRWLTGLEAHRAEAIGGAVTHDVEVDDLVAGHLHLSDGAFAQVLVQLSPFPMEGHWTTTVYGDEGAVEVRTGHGVRAWGRHGSTVLETGACDRFAAQMHDFVTAIRAGTPCAVVGRDGRAALAIALALIAATRGDGPVDVQPTATVREEHP